MAETRLSVHVYSSVFKIRLKAQRSSADLQLHDSEFQTESANHGSFHLGLWRGAFTCVRLQVTLCDPIWQMTPRSSEMQFP